MGNEFEGSQRPPEATGGPFLEFDLTSQAELLRSEEVYQRGRNSKTLAKHSDFRVVLNALGKGQRIQEHSAPSTISVQVLSGRLRMHVGRKLLDLPAGRLLVLERALPHDVEAVEDSVFLLTLSAPDKRA